MPNKKKTECRNRNYEQKTSLETVEISVDTFIQSRYTMNIMNITKTSTHQKTPRRKFCIDFCCTYNKWKTHAK